MNYINYWSYGVIKVSIITYFLKVLKPLLRALNHILSNWELHYSNIYKRYIIAPTACEL